MSVDLPEPDGPMTAVSSPSATVTETPRRASHGRVTGAVAAAEVTRGDTHARLRVLGRVLRMEKSLRESCVHS